MEPLDRPLALCLFDGKPATAGFIHESVKALSSLLIVLHRVFLSGDKASPVGPYRAGTTLVMQYQPMIDWAMLTLTLKTGPQSVLPSVRLARACIVATAPTKILFPSLSHIRFNSELCTSAEGHHFPTKWCDYTADIFCNMGRLVDAAPPPRLFSFPPNTVSSHQSWYTHGTCCHPWSSALDTLIPTLSGVVPQLRSSYSFERPS